MNPASGKVPNVDNGDVPPEIDTSKPHSARERLISAPPSGRVAEAVKPASNSRARVGECDYLPGDPTAVWQRSAAQPPGQTMAQRCLTAMRYRES